MKHFRSFFTVQSSSNEVKVSKHTVNSLKIISQLKTFDCLGDHQNIEIIDLKKKVGPYSLLLLFFNFSYILLPVCSRIENSYGFPFT